MGLDPSGDENEGRQRWARSTPCRSHDFELLGKAMAAAAGEVAERALFHARTPHSEVMAAQYRPDSPRGLLPFCPHLPRDPNATPTALLPQFLPIPNPIIHLVRQLVSHLPRQHTSLSAMMRLMRNHVTQHLRTNPPRPSPPVATKFRNRSAIIAKRSRQHLRAPRRTLRQPRAGLPHCAPRPVQLTRHLQMRRRKPHPLAPHVVHMRKDGHNAAAPAGRFRAPSSSLQPPHYHLIHPLIYQKDLGRSRPKSSPRAVPNANRPTPIHQVFTVAHDRPLRCRKNLPTLDALCAAALEHFPERRLPVPKNKKPAR
jgi:hypothetical protein